MPETQRVLVLRVAVVQVLVPSPCVHRRLEVEDAIAGRVEQAASKLVAASAIGEAAAQRRSRL